MGQNCQDTIGMCLESVKDSDKIIFLDGGSTDDTLEIVNGKAKVLYNKFDKSNPNMISDQRNYYLDYLKKSHKDDWVLVLDADEVLDTNGIKRIKEFIPDALSEVYSIKMRHLMYTLGTEDATQNIHFVLNRLFKVSDNLFYPNGEHCILNGEPGEGKLIDTQIWHLGYLGGAWDVKKRFDQQKLRNSGHTKEFLENWNLLHLTGQYPTRNLNIEELPKTILNNFGIDTDKLYFTRRRDLQMNHFIDAIHWRDFFKCKSAVEFGCGMGMRVYAMNQIGINAYGIELSKYATDNNYIKNKVSQGDITLKGDYGKPDLVVAYDVLEHVKYEDLDKAIDTIKCGKHILVSVPFRGTPNCDADPTHIIKESREWWVEQFKNKGLKEVAVPEHFLFKEQLLIFER